MRLGVWKILYERKWASIPEYPRVSEMEALILEWTTLDKQELDF